MSICLFIIAQCPDITITSHNLEGSFLLKNRSSVNKLRHKEHRMHLYNFLNRQIQPLCTKHCRLKSVYPSIQKKFETMRQWPRALLNTYAICSRKILSVHHIACAMHQWILGYLKKVPQTVKNVFRSEVWRFGAASLPTVNNQHSWTPLRSIVRDL